MSELIVLFENFVVLFMEFVFWLLLGLFIVGLMYELVLVDIFKKYMGNVSIKVIGKVVVIGVFLLFCFCGVILVVIGLCCSGVLKFVIVFFLVVILEIGVDLVLVFYVLLGLVFVIVCFIVVIISVIYVGLMVKWFDMLDVNN